MAEMQFDLVSPERRLASFAAQSVEIPGADGDMTVMADHAPTITTLRPGLMRVETGGETKEYVVSGGFAEIGAGGISVLAEKAYARADMAQSDLDEMVAAAHAAYEAAKSSNTLVDEAAKLLSDLQAVGTHIGLDPK
jgi:F-type H+-transporting ATPase subunit epsilon